MACSRAKFTLLLPANCVAFFTLVNNCLGPKRSKELFLRLDAAGMEGTQVTAWVQVNGYLAFVAEKLNIITGSNWALRCME